MSCFSPDLLTSSKGQVKFLKILSLSSTTIAQIVLILVDWVCWGLVRCYFYREIKRQKLWQQRVNCFSHMFYFFSYTSGLNCLVKGQIFQIVLLSFLDSFVKNVKTLSEQKQGTKAVAKLILLINWNFGFCRFNFWIVFTAINSLGDISTLENVLQFLFIYTLNAGNSTTEY